MVPVESPRNVIAGGNSPHYCSQKRMSYPAPSTTEERVAAIQRIILKSILCRHDAKEVKAALRGLETDQGACNTAKEMIVDRFIELVSSEDDTRVQNIISLYHLQKLQIEETPSIFHRHLMVFDRTPEVLEELARQLPCCDTEADFECDARVLLGTERSQQVADILRSKRARLLEHRQSQLREIERQNLKDFPNLYDHLQRMRSLESRNDRIAEINRMPIPLLCSVVMETRAAICRSVERLPEGKQVLFLLGNTGAGKSTALCFLCGDRMDLQADRYLPLDDFRGFIGNDGAASRTFMPNIGGFDDWVFIDFPGFDDTNGPLIELGMELALKALFLKHRAREPKVMVLEAITNIEGRYAAAARLGQRLSRLFSDKSNLILGITKYTQEANYIRLKALEEQERTKLFKPSKEVDDLQAEITLFQELNQGGKFDDQIEKKQQRLRQLQSNKAEVDSPSIREFRALLREKEKELSRQIGIVNVLRFDDLKPFEAAADCLGNLDVIARGTVELAPDRILDENIRALLVKRFEDYIVSIVNMIEDFPVELRGVRAFEKSILESSLVNTLISTLHPQIGQLLHLPEMDPTLVRMYDRKIVHDIIQKHMNAVISTLDISYIDNLLSKVVVETTRRDALKNKLARIQQYIVTQTGQDWEELRRDPSRRSQPLEERFLLPRWLQACCNIPFGAPRSVLSLFSHNRAVQANQGELSNLITASCDDLDGMFEMLLTLKQIVNVIEKKDDLEHLLQSKPIALDSFSALHDDLATRISILRGIYGGDEWNIRVNFLAERLTLHPFDARNRSHIDSLLVHACSLMEPTVSCVYEADVIRTNAETKPVTVLESSARQRNALIIKDLECISRDLKALLDGSQQADPATLFNEITGKFNTITSLSEEDVRELSRQDDQRLLTRANEFEFAVQYVHMLVERMTTGAEPQVADLPTLAEEIRKLLQMAMTESLIRSRVIAARALSAVSWADSKAKAQEESGFGQVSSFRATLQKSGAKPGILEVFGPGEMPELILGPDGPKSPLDRAFVAAALLEKYNFFLLEDR